MSFLSPKDSKPADEPVGEVATGARLLPRITIQAFCEHSQTAELVEAAIHDRRMSKVALTTHNGGIDGAVETYKSNPTPNLIIVETSLPPAEIPVSLERLAEVCDATTRLIVLGHVNDVLLYRELIRSGVSEYIVLPTTAPTLVTAISDLFAAYGEAEFRALETRVIKRLLRSGPRVVSTGGGAYINENTRKHIKRGGLTVWLNADLDVLWERVNKRDTRPLLKTENPRQTLENLMNARYPIYAEAEVTVISRDVRKETMVDEVLAAIAATRKI